MARATGSWLPTLVWSSLTALYAGLVFLRSEALSGSADPPATTPLVAARLPGREADRPDPTEPLPLSATPATLPPPTPAPTAPAAAARARPAPDSPGSNRPAPGRRAIERATLRDLAAAPGLAERLAIVDRGAARLDAEDRAELLARALAATPRSCPEDAAFRDAVVERLAPLSDLEPARRTLSVLVELSTERDERLAALRALARGPAPLSLEARASVRAAARSSDALVALEARSLLAVSDRRDGHSDSELDAE